MYDNVNEQAIIDQAMQAENKGQNSEQNEEKPSVAAQSESPEKVRPSKDENIQLLRARVEAAERRNQEFERYIQSLQQTQQPAAKQVEPDTDDFAIEDDTYVEGKQLKKYIKSLKNELQQTKKQFEEMSQTTTQSSAELRLKSKYSDFDSVVTPENVQKLAQLKPALYRSVMANADWYDKGESAYELIKNVVKADEYQEQERRIEENARKPRAAAVAAPQASDSPLARFGDYDRLVLTEERRQQVLKRLEEAKMFR